MTGSRIPAFDMELTVVPCPDKALALSNVVAVSEQDFENINPKHLMCKDLLVYEARSHPNMNPGEVGLAKLQRGLLQVSNGDPLKCTQYSETGIDTFLGVINVDLDTLVKKKDKVTVDGTKLVERLKEKFEAQVWNKKQGITVELFGENLSVTVTAMTPAVDGDEAADVLRGLLTKETTIFPNATQNGSVTLVNAPKAPSSLLGANFSFEKMGIGGLDAEFGKIFRRAFASRVMPPAVMKKLGQKHVRGMLLYGPPGCGKTLIARQIGKMLNAKEPKIVQGPEILSKFVGEAEKNIRELFADAQAEQQQRGDDSELHIIIMDELDAICKKRGSTGDSTGVHDNVVNQLLAMIDGVNSLNNVLLIGMTNRKDMLDPALIRPGRMEVQIEINLPDKKGRTQILNIYTAPAKENNALAADISIPDLAERTNNYSGAEIEGMVRAATSFAFTRQLDPDDLNKEVNPDDIRIENTDFDAAIEEIRPAFGSAEEDSLHNYVSGGFVEYGPPVERLTQDINKLFVQMQHPKTKTNLLTCLLEGPAGTGKTATAVHLALQYQQIFPFVKIISPSKYVGMSEHKKVAEIHSLFEMSYRSQMSVLVLDDLEALIEWVPLGKRFSNTVLQAIKVLLRKVPPKGKKLIVFGTTSCPELLSELQLHEGFNMVLSVSPLKDQAHFEKVILDSGITPDPSVAAECAAMCTGAGEIGIKRLQLVCEMARPDFSPQEFHQCLLTCGFRI